MWDGPCLVRVPDDISLSIKSGRQRRKRVVGMDANTPLPGRHRRRYFAFVERESFVQRQTFVSGADGLESHRRRQYQAEEELREQER